MARAALAGLLALAIALPAAAQDCATDAMIVFDGSASMAEIGMGDSGARIVEARAAMAHILPEVEHVRRLGLLTYGPGPGSGAGSDFSRSCDSSRLMFAPAERAAARALAALDALRPDGMTPLSAAVEMAAETLGYRTRPAMIVLVTDGNETCGGRPCALADRLAARAADLTIHVIGYRAEADLFAWNNPEQRYGEASVTRCLPDATGGLFVDANTEDELVEALRRTLGCPLAS